MASKKPISVKDRLRIFADKIGTPDDASMSAARAQVAATLPRLCVLRVACYGKTRWVLRSIDHKLFGKPRESLTSVRQKWLVLFGAYSLIERVMGTHSGAEAVAAFAEFLEREALRLKREVPNG
jgi:hypothetical protein